MEGVKKVRTLFLAWACLLLTIPCSADIIYVNWDDSGDFTTIQAAIDAANDLDTIIVSEGGYYENINFGGKDIILTSVDPAR